MEDDSQLLNNTFMPGPDVVGTEAFSSFVLEYRANIDLFFFVARVVGRVDEMRVRAAKALLPLSNDEENIGIIHTIENPDQTMKALNKHGNVLSANLINGLASSFQRYFASIIQLVALKNPNILRSSQQIRIDDVLRFSRHRELVRFIVDRKVNELSYGGLNDLEKFFVDRLGICLFQNDRERVLMRLMNEARNINVHNGGIVNELFASRVGTVEGFPYQKGKRFRLDFDEITLLVTNAMHVVTSLDSAISTKFSLKRRPHSRWLLRQQQT